MVIYVLGLKFKCKKTATCILHQCSKHEAIEYIFPLSAAFYDKP